MVRDLKKKRAPKDEVDAAVAELKARKAALEAIKPKPAPTAQEAEGAGAGAGAGACAEATAVKVEDLTQHFTSALALSNCPPGMTPQERFEMVVSVGQECIELSELA